MTFFCSQLLAELNLHSSAEQKPPFENPRSTTESDGYLYSVDNDSYTAGKSFTFNLRGSNFQKFSSGGPHIKIAVGPMISLGRPDSIIV